MLFDVIQVYRVMSGSYSNYWAVIAVILFFLLFTFLIISTDTNLSKALSLNAHPISVNINIEKTLKNFSGSALSRESDHVIIQPETTKNSQFNRELHKLLVIPSEEGLISQFMRVAGFLEAAIIHNRSLSLFPFISHHYADIIDDLNHDYCGRIHLCDIFIFPNNVKCYHSHVRLPHCSIAQTIEEHNCRTVQFNNWMEEHPEHFGLESYHGIDLKKKFNWVNSTCAILGQQGGPKKCMLRIILSTYIFPSTRQLCRIHNVTTVNFYLIFTHGNREYPNTVY